MLQLLISALALIVFLVFPVLLAARLVGAKRVTFGYALLAVVLQVAMFSLLQAALLDDLLTFVLTVILGALIYAAILQTTPLRGFLIGVLTLAIEIIFILALAGLLTHSA